MRLSKLKSFSNRQIRQIEQGGIAVLLKKIFKLPFFILAIPIVLIIRLIRPWLLVRLGALMSSRIGHFAANTELYLCEQRAGINLPHQRHLDIFYLAYKPVCNQQLRTMWQRVLPIWPSWILEPIDWVNRHIPGGMLHEIGNNTQHDRDVHNLLDQFPPHLRFTTEEAARGEAGLLAMGIPTGAQFVCLTVRDSAYLAAHQPSRNHDYHNYRDSDIQNYVLAAESLAERDYFVIRMGVKVIAPINSAHPKVIDYATNGMRSDFMDIYLGARCTFCISVGAGFDAVPLIFRRPIAYVNMLPPGYLFTFRNQFLGIFKHHLDSDSGRELSLSEIFSRKVGLCMSASDYKMNGVDVIENTPEEIRDVAIEMVERLNGTWLTHADDIALQQRFWEIFPTDVVDAYEGKRLHGEIRGRFGANYLRNNQEFLQRE